MNNKLFIQLPTGGGHKYISISSIALVEDKGVNGSQITMKEKDATGNNISFLVHLNYANTTIEINRLISLP